MSLNLPAALCAGARLVALLTVFIASPCAAQSDWASPAQEEALARARVDLRRSQIGLPALARNAQLETAARGHANYLMVNNLSGHYQNLSQYPTGFTGGTPSDRISAAGYVAVPSANGSTSLATGEVVARGPFHGEDAVDSLIQAIYHRMVIFGSSFDEQGAGISQGSQGVTVINFGSRKFPQPAAPAGWVGIYPYDGQTGIVVDFYSQEESPSPIPTSLNLNRVGYPVSLHIDDARTLSVGSFTLAPVGGNPVPTRLLSSTLADATLRDPEMRASAAAIVPLGVLAYGTTYEANFSGSADGVPLTKTWRFTTVPYTPLATAGPSTAYVGDTVALKFSGGSGRYVNVGYSYTAQVSQPGWIGDDGFGFHADTPGTIDVTVTDGENTQATLPLVIKTAAEKLLPLAAGWNLVGNSTSIALTAGTLFGSDAAKVTTVWKWLPATGNWAFYAPSLPDGGAAYAASKGYAFLSTISPGDGFWVYANAAFMVQLPAGAAVSSASLRSTLGAGWNLIAVGDNRAPRGFNNVVGPAGAGDIPLNLTSLWAWDNPSGNWYFYAPSLDQSGSLAGYVQQKSYLDFGAKTLDPVTGFWVNRP